jgi:hypothetical protein
LARVLTYEETLMMPVERLRPIPAKNPRPVPVYVTAPGKPPITPAHEVCGASANQIFAGGRIVDLTHRASVVCERTGCGFGMCDEHLFEWAFRGEKKKVCWRCWRDLRMYLQNTTKVGHDPWIALIGEKQPELAELLARETLADQPT